MKGRDNVVYETQLGHLSFSPHCILILPLYVSFLPTSCFGEEELINTNTYPIPLHICKMDLCRLSALLHAG